MAIRIETYLPNGAQLPGGIKCDLVPREGDLVEIDADHDESNLVGEQYIVEFVRWHVGKGGTIKTVVVQLKDNT